MPAVIEIHRLTPSDARQVPWKNGRGVTHELALWPPSASFERGDFDWRIACAGVDAAGPFSAFPGFERLLVVIEGEGLALRHGARPALRVPRLQPHGFSGDDATSAELLAGPVTDLNVLARRGRVAARLSVLRGAGHEPLGASQVFLHLVQGVVHARVACGEPIALAAQESLWVRGGHPSDAIELAGGACTALLVRIEELPA
jgi:environmental stress-induced protein Ves